MEEVYFEQTVWDKKWMEERWSAEGQVGLCILTQVVPQGNLVLLLLFTHENVPKTITAEFMLDSSSCTY